MLSKRNSALSSKKKRLSGRLISLLFIKNPHEKNEPSEHCPGYGEICEKNGPGARVVPYHGYDCWEEIHIDRPKQIKVEHTWECTPRVYQWVSIHATVFPQLSIPLVFFLPVKDPHKKHKPPNDSPPYSKVCEKDAAGTCVTENYSQNCGKKVDKQPTDNIDIYHL